MSNKYIEQLVKMAEEDGIGSSVMKGIGMGVGVLGGAAAVKKGGAMLSARKLNRIKATRAAKAPATAAPATAAPAPKASGKKSSKKTNKAVGV